MTHTDRARAAFAGFLETPVISAKECPWTPGTRIEIWPGRTETRVSAITPDRRVWHVGHLWI